MAGSYVEQFPEPMMKSWLRVLQWYWSDDVKYLDPISNTRLAQATQFSITPPAHMVSSLDDAVAQWHDKNFVKFVSELHAEKNAAYGDSWKRRGEMLGILANIARKIDRLEVGGETSDENQADTAIDLLVYLCKYRWWLALNYGLSTPYNIRAAELETDRVEALLQELDAECEVYALSTMESAVKWLVDDFKYLEQHVTDKDLRRTLLNVDKMLPNAFLLAKQLWSQ